ncbi:MAG: Stp1/IreP family PP2C-type Ser/Thr phosphatase [Acidimicrobiales bacterium]|nr:Stp1/IreP family PP2C-type Ser/Thr phosphatase [Acidimicrobiales bacterium]
MNDSPQRRLRLTWGGATDQGRVRANNQDAMYADWGLFVVADGMGGHQGGEVAANLAVRTMTRAKRDTIRELHDAVQEANKVVYETAIAQPELHGMGTTLTSLAVIREGGSRKFVALNVGDSRIYHYRNNQLTQLTDDHSYVAELMRRGELDEEAAAVHPYRNMLTRAIGVHSEVEIDEWLVDPVAGDRFLLCSDGLTNEVSDDAIAERLSIGQDPSATARELVHLANERGGRDNSTALVVDVQIDDIDGESDQGSVEHEDGGETPGVSPAEESTPEKIAATDAFELRTKSSSSYPKKQRSWLNDRVGISVATVLIASVLLIASAAMVATIGWYARDGYHVGVVANHVVIQKGRVGGLLWFNPTLEEWTEIQVAQLNDQDQRNLIAGKPLTDLAQAREFLAQLRTRLVDPDSESRGGG